MEVSVLANKCFIGVKYTIRIPNTVDAVVGDVVNLAQYPHKIVATRIRPKVERSTAEFFDIVAGTKALSYLTFNKFNELTPAQKSYVLDRLVGSIKLNTIMLVYEGNIDCTDTVGRY